MEDESVSEDGSLNSEEGTAPTVSGCWAGAPMARHDGDDDNDDAHVASLQSDEDDAQMAGEDGGYCQPRPKKIKVEIEDGSDDTMFGKSLCCSDMSCCS